MNFSGEISFPSKVPEFLQVLFNLGEKHSPVSSLGLNALVQFCCLHCAHFDILSSFFQKQSTNQPKKYRGNVLLLHRKAHAKIQVLLKENKFYLKKSLTSLLHQAIQLHIERKSAKRFIFVSL